MYEKNSLSTSFEGLKNRTVNYSKFVSEKNSEKYYGDFDNGANKQKCQICSSSNLYKFLSLGHHPNPDGFLTEEKIKEPEIFFPLDVYFCEDCSLVQLGYAPDPKILFTDSFIYTTGSNKGLTEDFHNLAELIVKSFNLKEGDFVIDIGGNDGTLLENYLPYKINVLNIDPSKAAGLA